MFKKKKKKPDSHPGKSVLGDHTRLDTVTTTFTWTIENFEQLLLQPTGTGLESFPFKCGDSWWSLALFPNGRNDTDKDFVGLFLVHYKSAPGITSVYTHFKYYILNDQGEFENVKYASTIFDLNTVDDDWGYGQFCSRSLILGSSNNGNGYLIDNGKLKLGIELSIAKTVVNFPIPANTQSLMKMKTPYVPGYSEFLSNGTLSDVKIIDANNEIIQAHKIILMNNSTYFAGMFSHEMEENLEGRVFAQDISPQILKEMLKFLYCGKLEQIEVSNYELIQELFKAGDRYGILALKELCEDFLINNISEENAISSFELADTYNNI